MGAVTLSHHFLLYSVHTIIPLKLHVLASLIMFLLVICCLVDAARELASNEMHRQGSSMPIKGLIFCVPIPFHSMKVSFVTSYNSKCRSFLFRWNTDMGGSRIGFNEKAKKKKEK